MANPQRAVTRAMIALDNALYDGGGQSNALQAFATETALAAAIAGGTGPEEVEVFNDVYNSVRVWLMNTSPSQGCTFCLGIYDHSGTNLLEVVEYPVLTTDQTFDTTRDAWGLSPTVAEAAKQPFNVDFSILEQHGAVLRMWVSASDGGVWYARYQVQSV